VSISKFLNVSKVEKVLKINIEVVVLPRQLADTSSSITGQKTGFG